MKKNLIVSSLTFASDYLSDFDNLCQFWNDNESDFIRGSDKITTETLLLLYILERNGHLEGSNDTKIKIIQSLIPEARSVRNASLIMRFPQLSLSLGIAHITLNKLGYEDVDFDYIIKNSLSVSLSKSGEKLAFRNMDADWIRYLYSDDEIHMRSMTEHHESSILNRNTHPIFMQREDFYALTHCIMYLTDFGKKDFPFCNDVHHISKNIEDSIKWHLHEKDFDLLSELILCYIYLNGDINPIVAVALNFVISSWNKIGFLPSRSFSVKKYNSLEGLQKKAYSFANIYHTLFVGTMLASECLLRNINIEYKKSTYEYTPDFSEQYSSLRRAYVDYFFKESEACDWIVFLDQANISDEIRVSSIFDVFLQTCTKEYELDMVINLIEYSLSNKIEKTDVVSNSILYMKLQEMNGGNYGAHFLLKENTTDNTCIHFKKRVNCILEQYNDLEQKSA